MKRIALWIIAGSIALAGCTAPREALEVTNPDPSIKIPAMKIAASRGDQSAVKQLVADLESDDAAVRFYAIDALHKITGEDLGYVYYEEELQRRPAVERWQAWLKKSTPSTRPSN